MGAMMGGMYSSVAAVHTLVGQLNSDDARCVCVCVVCVSN